jgi:hypothetical protein
MDQLLELVHRAVSLPPLRGGGKTPSHRDRDRVLPDSPLTKTGIKDDETVGRFPSI